MPATLVHPLFALPFRRLGFPTSALVMGAMTPDVAYVVGAPWWGQHHVTGIFAFALPMGLVALWLYHRLVAPALGFDDTFRFGPAPRFLAIVGAVIVGAATHVFVDGFTHYYGWAVADLPLLRQRVLGPPIYKWLQYGLSVVGVGVLAYWARHRMVEWLADRRVVAALAAITVLAIGQAGVVASQFDGVLQVRVFVVRAVAGALVLAAVALVANGVWFQVRRR